MGLYLCGHRTVYVVYGVGLVYFLYLREAVIMDKGKLILGIVIVIGCLILMNMLELC